MGLRIINNRPGYRNVICISKYESNAYNLTIDGRIAKYQVKHVSLLYGNEKAGTNGTVGTLRQKQDFFYNKRNFLEQLEQLEQASGG